MKISPEFDSMTNNQKNWVFWYGVKAAMCGALIALGAWVVHG